MILQEGDSGSGVVLLQKALGVSADGQFGPKTKAAVLAFQSHNGLVADGVVGPLTQAALRGISPPPPPPHTDPIDPITGMWTPTGKPRVHVIDLYHLDDVKDWATLASHAAAGIHKIATGTSSKDSLFASRWPLFTQHGMRRGFYQWFLPENGSGMFDFSWSIVQAAGGVKSNDRIFALDYEPPSVHAGHIPEIKAWGDRCVSVSGRRPWFYSSKSALRELAQLGDISFLKNWYQWLADPSDAVPPVIAPFSFVALHQLAEQTFPGMGGNKVDVNWFPGSAEELDLL